MLAGTYDLTIKARGFKNLEAKEIVATANQNRSLGSLQLEIGGTAETITVAAEVAQIQLASAEKSGTITTSQLQNIAVKGRDFFALLNTVPGVVDNFSQARETASPIPSEARSSTAAARTRRTSPSTASRTSTPAPTPPSTSSRTWMRSPRSRS